MDILTLFSGNSSGFAGIFEILFVLGGTFALSSFIGWVYKKTYKWKAYKQEYVQTIVILPVIISMVMLTVNSNVATAFTMAGALSIIRFRNSIKDTRDLGFIFFAVVIGMAMGMKFYLLGIIGTIIVSLIFYFMDRTNLFGAMVNEKFIIKIQTQDSKESLYFQDIFQKNAIDFSLQSIETLSSSVNEFGEKIENFQFTYRILTSVDFDMQNCMWELKKINSQNSVTIIKEL